MVSLFSAPIDPLFFLAHGVENSHKHARWRIFLVAVAEYLPGAPLSYFVQFEVESNKMQTARSERSETPTWDDEFVWSEPATFRISFPQLLFAVLLGLTVHSLPPFPSLRRA